MSEGTPPPDDSRHGEGEVQGPRLTDRALLVNQMIRINYIADLFDCDVSNEQVQKLHMALSNAFREIFGDGVRHLRAEYEVKDHAVYWVNREVQKIVGDYDDEMYRLDLTQIMAVYDDAINSQVAIDEAEHELQKYYGEYPWVKNLVNNIYLRLEADGNSRHKDGETDE